MESRAFRKLTFSTGSLDELKEKLRAFEDKKRETEFAKQDFDILLDGETKRLSKNILDEDITRFRRDMLAPLTAGF